ncbi:hypothetical protein SADUNF_Sadunf18G0061800 [Salix dunnii]|uniref:HSF-type DNA-binding domain-containing protein n=1 Tax=Salix dunnii TaxID=1413687 RepID=A0A835J3J3_9ROSI|nr:hypothetical protein SADUNF_Sadunf18G0061800 [Salix dunnii]
MEANNIIAPFVLKTYQMVSDPATDSLISWGRANNSFIVVNPLDFSQRILPVYFKHNNFSSFVRQLNTYGFRKVDPDRWEFANEWFLRGQKQLLKSIVRRKHGTNKGSSYMQVNTKGEDCDDEDIIMEIARLKQEQKAVERELDGMNKRLEATERRPQQMMAFIYQVVEDPDLLPRMILEKERTRQIKDKKQRLMISSSATSSSGMAISSASTIIKSEVVNEEGSVGVISSPETVFDVDKFCQSSPDESNINAIGWLDQANYGCAVAGPSPSTAGSMGAGFGTTVAVLPQGNKSVIGYGGDWGDHMNYFGEMAAGVEDRPRPSYPFSLLGGGF